MTITTAFWLLTVTFSGTDIALVESAKFGSLNACRDAGFTIGSAAFRMGEGMYTFNVACDERVVTLGVAL